MAILLDAKAKKILAEQGLSPEHYVRWLEAVYFKRYLYTGLILSVGLLIFFIFCSYSIYMQETANGFADAWIVFPFMAAIAFSIVGPIFYICVYRPYRNHSVNPTSELEAMMSQSFYLYYTKVITLEKMSASEWEMIRQFSSKLS